MARRDFCFTCLTPTSISTLLALSSHKFLISGIKLPLPMFSGVTQNYQLSVSLGFFGVGDPLTKVLLKCTAVLANFALHILGHVHLMWSNFKTTVAFQQPSQMRFSSGRRADIFNLRSNCKLGAIPQIERAPNCVHISVNDENNAVWDLPQPNCAAWHPRRAFNGPHAVFVLETKSPVTPKTPESDGKDCLRPAFVCCAAFLLASDWCVLQYLTRLTYILSFA